jgi:hypothetical protein
VEPTIKLAGDAGVTAIEDNVGVLVVVAATIIVKGTDGLVCFWQVKRVPVPAIEKGTTLGKKYITNLHSFVSSSDFL